MKLAVAPETTAGVRELAQRWFERELEIAKRAHGDRWPEHEAWVRSYVKEEVRQRLLERGWRAA